MYHKLDFDIRKHTQLIVALNYSLHHDHSLYLKIIPIRKKLMFFKLSDSLQISLKHWMINNQLNAKISESIAYFQNGFDHAFDDQQLFLNIIHISPQSIAAFFKLINISSKSIGVLNLEKINVYTLKIKKLTHIVSPFMSHCVSS